MNFPLYIAGRYLVSKKSHNIINIISVVSITGIMVGTMALIIVLSVFNGFEKLVLSLFNAFNPDLLITVKEGKTFSSKIVSEEEIRKIPGVIYMTDVIEENALVKYLDKQYIVTLKGVDNDYGKMSGLDTMMTEGNFVLRDKDKNFAVFGYGVAYYLGANLDDYLNPISVYVPERAGKISGGFESSFRSDAVFPSGFFSVQQDFDTKYVILPIRFVSNLLDYKEEITGIEVRLSADADYMKVQQQLKKMFGPGFSVKNRFEQQELLYKIMKSEKWAIFLILSFILLVATFNIIGSLSILILDKRQDIAVLQCLGVNQSNVKQVFLTLGLLVTLIGAISGLLLGSIICVLQQIFGFVKLGSMGSTFVVSAYPVHLQAADFIFVFLTVLVIGFLAALYPVYNIRKIDTRLLYRNF
jgi:lipoprotein-releasing system permease protein